MPSCSMHVTMTGIAIHVLGTLLFSESTRPTTKGGVATRVPPQSRIRESAYSWLRSVVPYTYPGLRHYHHGTTFAKKVDPSPSTPGVTSPRRSDFLRLKLVAARAGHANGGRRCVRESVDVYPEGISVQADARTGKRAIRGAGGEASTSRWVSGRARRIHGVRRFRSQEKGGAVLRCMCGPR